MQDQNCDASPLKQELKAHLLQIEEQIQRSLAVIDNEDHCLLSEFDDIGAGLKKVVSAASTFYLHCYLSSFTTKKLDISMCIGHLSERRHGALIVVQRQDELQTFMHSGIAVGASLTYSLLESIFYPGSPLHDGAVLIQGDQIVSAANVLPVSSRKAVYKKLGTRHRAAIGLSEQTDALIIVVSEETGNASFAFKGKLHPINSIEQVLHE